MTMSELGSVGLVQNVGSTADPAIGKTPDGAAGNRNQSASDAAIDAEIDALLGPSSSDAELDAELDALLRESAPPERPFGMPSGRDGAQPRTLSDREPFKDPSEPEGEESSADEPASTPAESPYSFPPPEIPASIKAASNDWLVTELDRLCNAWGPRGSRPAPYHTIRQLVCHISLELNLRARVAPRFRGMRSPRPKKGFPIYPESDRLLSNDRQVIDLHWLHCRRVFMSIAERKWEGLANPADFDFELASAFVASIGYVSKKMAILGMGHMEYELAALQSKSLVNRWRIIQKGRDDASGRQFGVMDIRRAFEHAAVDTPGITDKIDDWVMLWQCWRLTTNLRVLGPLYAVAAGVDMPDRSNLKRRLQTMKKYLPAGSP
jgi:hypothetical protein